MLTLELILQVLLTNGFVNIDCLVRDYMVCFVNNAQSGNTSVCVIIMTGVEIKVCFSVINSVNRLFHIWNRNMGVFWLFLVKFQHKLNSFFVGKPTHLYFDSFFFLFFL